MRRFLQIILFIAGLLTVIAVVGYYIYETNGINKLTDRCNANTTGVVTYSYRGQITNNMTIICTADFKVNGLPYVVKSGSKSFYEKGDEVIVHYNPDDPSEAFIGDKPMRFVNTWSLVMLGAMGVLAMAMATGIYKLSVKD